MVVDYQNSKIYKIINDALPDLVYYGSTVNTLSKRFGQHKKKSNICSSKQLFDCDVKPQIFLVESFPCNSKDELKAKERWYIENNVCVNKNIPNRTSTEYYIDNKEKILENQKQYYEDNKEKITVYRLDNKEKINEYDKQYKIDNKEEIKLQRAKHYQDNKERISAKDKQYRLDNKERIKIQKAKHYQDNKERILAKDKQYRLDNKV